MLVFFFVFAKLSDGLLNACVRRVPKSLKLPTTDGSESWAILQTQREQRGEKDCFEPERGVNSHDDM